MKSKHGIRAVMAVALAACAAIAAAHGDEPHGDEPHPATSAATGSPRFEAATEAFEMVGRLESGGLIVFVNRFETSEPVLQAAVEVESGEHKASADYRADQGSYVVSEPRLLQALEAAGSHHIVVTVTSGNEADLLETTLDIRAAEGSKQATPLPLGAALAMVLGLGAVGAGGFALHRRRRHKGDNT